MLTVEEKFKLILRRYLEEKCIEHVFVLLKKSDVHLTITRGRNTKLGDYRHPHQGKGHRITINGDLNRHEFLFVLLHEMAHLNTWVLYKNKVMPHGAEWKGAFAVLLREAVAMKFFPGDVEEAITKGFLARGTFTAKWDDHVKLLLRNHSEKRSMTVADVPEQGIFEMKNGRKFVKLERIKKRFRCRDVATGRHYVVHPMAEVTGFEGGGGAKTV